MKKVLATTLLALPLIACSNEQQPATPTVEDTKIVISEMQQQPGKSTIIASGEMGDYILKLDATDALLAVAAKAKTAKMLSVDPVPHAAEGVCLLGIIPQKTMETLGTPENKCNYRLVCGAIENVEEMYAVELCEE